MMTNQLGEYGPSLPQTENSIHNSGCSPSKKALGKCKSQVEDTLKSANAVVDEGVLGLPH
jgi:hypothetical protein